MTHVCLTPVCRPTAGKEALRREPPAGATRSMPAGTRRMPADTGRLGPGSSKPNSHQPTTNTNYPGGKPSPGGNEGPR